MHADMPALSLLIMGMARSSFLISDWFALRGQGHTTAADGSSLLLQAGASDTPGGQKPCERFVGRGTHGRTVEHAVCA